MDSAFVLCETVVCLESFGAAFTGEGKRVVGVSAVGDDLLGANVLGGAVGAVVDAVLGVTLEMKLYYVRGQ